jgi:hypothetical protein
VIKAVDLRYSRPKVMLVDVPHEAYEQVVASGYNVVVGSLGRPIRVPASDKYLPVVPNGRLPGFAEQEVVVVQHRAPDPRDATPEDNPTVTEKTRIWGSSAEGEIDTRPWLAHAMSDNAERILRHGGVFICFCEPHRSSGLVHARPPVGYGGLSFEEELRWTVWDLVPQLNGLHVEADHGQEITPSSYDLLDVLAPHLKGATFNCVIDVPEHRKGDWIELAHSKYGRTVAGIYMVAGEKPDHGEAQPGWVILLPQVENLGACVVALLDHVLPRLARKIFPESENTSWLHEADYELPAVGELKTQIMAARREAEKLESELREAVEQQRANDGWMHTLLTGTDDDLVGSVETALNELGLKNVKKVDDEEEARTSGRRREDLQVWGDGPVVLVEVKGITNLPKESNSLQVTKYLIPRMKQWKQTNIRGLSVINQQRGLPALDRENTHTFQQDVLDNAEEQGFGLITTVDLFRLVRNKRRWSWPETQVAPLLYGNGRIAPIPLHYERVGAIDGFFEHVGAITITVTDAGFGVGDDLAFILPIDYEQEVVESIRLNDASVERVDAGDRVGVKTKLTKAQARIGVAVYRVLSGTPTA